MNEPIPEPVVLNCGCFIRCDIVDGTKTMFLTPCRPGCPNYANAITEAAEQRRPVEYRKAP